MENACTTYDAIVPSLYRRLPISSSSSSSTPAGCTGEFNFGMAAWFARSRNIANYVKTNMAFFVPPTTLTLGQSSRSLSPSSLRNSPSLLRPGRSESTIAQKLVDSDSESDAHVQIDDQVIFLTCSLSLFQFASMKKHSLEPV